MKLHKMNIFLLTNLLIVSSCTSAQMPSKTETIKTDNNKENNVSKPLELPTRTLTLTYKKNGIENPLIPEQIDYIEIVDKETILVPVSDINVANKEFKTQANKKDSKNIIAFDGKGQFVFKNISDKAILNFKVKGSKVIAKIPVFFNKEEKNLRILIERDENNDLKIYGGIPKKDGSLDDTKEVFTIIKDDTGRDVFQVIKKGRRNTFKIEELEKNSKEETEAKEEKSEAVDEKEAKKIQENIIPVSPAAGFIGNWSFSLFNQSYNLIIREKGNNTKEVEGELFVGLKNYKGTGPYDIDGKNTIYINADGLDREAGYTANIKLRLEVKGSNKLDVKIDKITGPLEALNGVLLHLTRTIPIPEPVTPQATPTPEPTPTGKPIEKDKLLAEIKEELLINKRVTTIAGMVEQGRGYVDGVTSIAKFNQPSGLAVDSSGNLFIADTENHRIRKISTDGIVSTIAGSSQGFNEGNGTNAKFNYPSSIAIDNAGNLFVADTGNSRIRKITPEGTVSTLAGRSSGFADGNREDARFHFPNSITIDNAGNLFVADTNNHKIRKITPNGLVSTIAGSTSGFADGMNSQAKFNRPNGIVADRTGNLFVIDEYNCRVRKINSTGMVSSFAGNGYNCDNEGLNVNGFGTNASFEILYGIGIDTSGNLFVTAGSRIKKITTAGKVTTFSGDSFMSSMSGNRGLSMDGSLVDASFGYPEGVVVDNSGTIFIADTFYSRIRKIN